MLALVGSRNAKRLGLAPAGLFTDADDWVGVVHGSKISRHSATTERPGSFQAAVVHCLLAKRQQLRWEQAGGVMAAGVEIRRNPLTASKAKAYPEERRAWKTVVTARVKAAATHIYQ